MTNSSQSLAFLREKWGDRSCPMCGANAWAVQDKVFQLNEFSSGNLVIGGPLVPVVPVTCTNCGNTVLVNAIISGAVQPEDLGSEAQK
jgi:predicted nucleic-acid-binding Zn-ribbon protein